MSNKTLLHWMESGDVSVPRLLLKHYHQLGLDEKNLVTLLQIKSALDQGDLFPDTEAIAEAMNLSAEQVFTQIHQLIQKQVLDIETQTSFEGKSRDIYRLTPLYERLAILLSQQETKELETAAMNDEAELYQLFEQEFGRPLSPIELETITAWIDDDKYKPELIRMALKEAVLSKATNLRYIDRILLNWQRKNITSKEQVLAERQKFQDARDHSKQPKRKREVPMVDWLNGSD